MACKRETTAKIINKLKNIKNKNISYLYYKIINKNGKRITKYKTSYRRTD